jgi:hypothetical protein
LWAGDLVVSGVGELRRDPIFDTDFAGIAGVLTFVGWKTLGKGGYCKLAIARCAAMELSASVWHKRVERGEWTHLRRSGLGFGLGFFTPSEVGAAAILAV